MARSYASVVRGPEPAPAPKPRSVLRADAPAWTPPPRCYYCGSAASVCEDCAQHPWMSAGLQPVVKDGLCGEHCVYHFTKAHAFFGLRKADFIPQTCASCRAEHPLEARDVLELKGWSYERANLEKPLKSPNGGRFNIVFVPVYRYVRVGEAKSSAEQRALWAQAAYDKEMEFSGETKRADVMKSAVLGGDPDVSYKLWEAGAE